MKSIIDKMIKTSSASSEEIVELLDNNSLELFEAASQVTQNIFGTEVHIRGIIEFSNYCSCACHYCGIRCSNSIERYRMEPDEIADIAKEAIHAGYQSIVLQSGEDPYYHGDKISEIIKQIKAIKNIAITLSIGERSFEEYKQWKIDGADRFLLKHETADENLYNKYHPHSSFKKRMECLYNLKQLGYQTGSGFMIGLPGQTLESLAQDILLLKELDVDMAGIGVFIPHPETPLKNGAAGNNIIATKCVAITRILLKRPHLPATTSIVVNNKEDNYNPFISGANVVMKKLEPYKYQKLYEIYPNPTIKDMSILETRRNLEASIESFDKTIAKTRGDAITIGDKR